jgi:hypothetical protein
VYWVHLTKDRNQWHALLITVLSFGINKRRGISCLAERLFSQRRVSVLSAASLRTIGRVKTITGL